MEKKERKERKYNLRGKAKCTLFEKKGTLRNITPATTKHSRKLNVKFVQVDDAPIMEMQAVSRVRRITLYL